MRLLAPKSFAGLLVSGVLATCSLSAAAQPTAALEGTEPTTNATPTAAVTQGTEPAPALEPSAASAQGTEPAPSVAPDAAPVTATPAPVAQGAEPATTTAWEVFTSAIAPLKLGMFIDAYGAWQTSGPGTLATLSGHRAFTGQGANLRAENGFSVAFIGLDISYDTGSFGAVADLRFGEAAAIFHGLTPKGAANDIGFGIDHFTQAYVLWRPVAPLELDLGMFMSPFGLEALESYKNPNYTLSALYTYGQPSLHTGLKTTWQINDALSAMLLVVNGSNNISEAQQNFGLAQAPNLGASVGYAPNDALSFSLGGLYALDSKHNDDDGVDGFLDFVGSLQLGALTSAVNVDFIWTRDGAPSGADRHFVGGSLTVGYRFLESLALAARGEYLRDDANFDGRNVWELVTGTLTVDVQPIPKVPNLIVRWENRWERSNQRIFGKDSRGTEDTEDDSYRRNWFESVIGVVATTPP